MAQIADIIKYEGDNSTFIWKHPCEDFNSLTQLIVHETQEAIFFMNGQALDLFGPGRYTLETQNLPYVGKMLNRITDDKTPFHCEVYFINKAEQMSIKWGTDSKVQYIDPVFNFPVSIGASGDMNLRVEDSRKLLLKLVGTDAYLTQSKLVSFFRVFLMTYVKSYMAQVIKEKSINIFEIDAGLTEFSLAIKELLKGHFANFGISLEMFNVATIVRPEGDKTYETLRQQYTTKIQMDTELLKARTEAEKLVIDSEAQAKKRAQEGYTYQQERGFGVAEQMAQNEGVGNFTNAGIGMGAMMGVGGAVGGVMGGMMNDTVTAFTTVPVTNKFCDNCGTQLASDVMFCEECGTPVASKKTCANCGYEFERPGKFCPKCGTKREG